MAERFFTVYGVPVAKGRPRFARRGKFVQSYTPEKTVNYENLVKLSYAEKYGGEEPLQGPIEMVLTAYFPIPKSVSKKKHAELASEQEWHIKLPDTDNCVKSVMDSIQHIAFENDSHVCSIIAKKLYSDKPRVEVILRELRNRRLCKS